MEARIAEVFFRDSIAGTLVETGNGGTRFSYLAGWQQQIGCCLPLERREHEWSNGLHPFFENLGPEGWLREQQARTAHIANEDDFGILLRFGADCIGAVSLRDPSPLADLATVTKPMASPGRTISGVQRKLLVVKNNGIFEPAGDSGPAPYIAKFNSDSIPTLVRNEALSLGWTAAVLGNAEVNAFETAQVTGVDEGALIVKRFDRTNDGKKLRLEDFAQILCKPAGRNHDGKYQASYEDVAKVIKTYSARPAIDLSKFFRRLLVFVLIGNCDGHLKNFSLLETPSGFRLSPLYDVVNTAIYPNYDQNLALHIGGKKVMLDQVTKFLLDGFGLSIGLSKKMIDQAFEEIRKGVVRAVRILEPPPAEPSGGFISRYQEIVSRACSRILDI